MKTDRIEISGLSIPVYSVNTLVIGSGAAALNAAVNLVDLGVKDVAIVTDRWGGGTSNNAGSDKQTYYKLSLVGKVPDAPGIMAEDLFNGGCMHGDIALCEAQHSAQAFYHLVRLGVSFPHDKYGGYVGYKTDHDRHGRGTSAGPLTSHLMFEALAREVRRKDIEVFDGLEVIALLTGEVNGEKSVTGAVALDLNSSTGHELHLVVFNAINVILGTGGPAGMYRDSVYPVSQTGSTGLALRIGATGHNLTESQFGMASIMFRWNVSGSYQQVIPRYISTDKEGNDEREFLNDFFPDLRSLCLAIFLKGYQWPFDPRKVRDYGSSLIDILVYRERIQKGRRIFLDYTRNPFTDREAFALEHLPEEAYNYLKNSNALAATPIERLRRMNEPAIDLYRSHSIDISSEPLEIAVCAQHNNGGLKGSKWWESNIRHLFPVGEVNGTHGVYRPGGSALNAGQVGGLRAAMFISKRYHSKARDFERFLDFSKTQLDRLLVEITEMVGGKADDSILENAAREIGERMSACGAFIRDPEMIEKAVDDATSLKGRLDGSLKINGFNGLSAVFKLHDACLTHAVYLDAIAEYIRQGGKSRGSYLVKDPDGEPAHEKLGDEWRFNLSSGDDFTGSHILEITYDDENAQVLKKWVKVRPIPDEEAWFEQVWKDYREDRIIGDNSDER